MLKRTVLGLFLVALSFTPAAAEQVYVRNRAFKGPVQGSGKSIKIGMKAFAEAMGLAVTEQGGAFFVHPREVAGNDFGIISDPGAVYVVGKRVDADPGAAGDMLISLWQAAEAAGFRAQANASLGTIDVNKAPTPKIDMPVAMDEPAESTSADPTGRKPVKRGTIPGKGDDGLRVLTGMPPKRINKPGMAVDVQQALIPGRHNLVVFGADW